MNGITNQAYSTELTVDDFTHLKENGNEKLVVIISGLAGTGKSTLLCHYYEEIKKAKPDHWVIKINLVDHYETILKQDNITLSNAVDIFVNLVNVVDDKSSFSRSLLRNRLERGDRIIFMFDGFDEVNDLCQDKAIELMKVITKNKSKLYVTTRPYMQIHEDLQFQLSQLAYNLENFTEKDQINYVTSYWVKEVSLSGDNDKSLQQFAKFLVERVSETLKDKEKSFVGIPLQCRILAECFQSNIKKLITKKCAMDNEESRRSEDVISDLLVDRKFDLINLFNRLMETKRKVFREEKANATNTNQIILDAINRLIQDIEDHLTKLAIKTIVTDQQLLNVLLPSQTSYQSDQDITNWENKTTSNALKFGLTFKSGDESKVQFLHRTYAEYLFARYLYQGFLLDEKRHNKLLENESIRMLIVKKILATPEYDGVQVFFNSMLKELVKDDQEWRNIINNRNLPERIKTFTENFNNRFFTQENVTETVTSVTGNFTIVNMTSKPFDTENALHFSLLTGKTIIFTFLCDCPDATLDNKQIRTVMMKSFMDGTSKFKFSFFRQVESKYFKRFLNYVGSEADEIMSKFADYPAYLPPCGLEYSEWNGEEQKETVHHLLQFMANQREAFDKYFHPNFDSYLHLYGDNGLKQLLHFFIFNKNYESHLEIFLELLSRSTAYSNDFQFENLLKKTFCSKEHFISGRIEKVLISLHRLERQNLLTQLYGIVLAIEPESFQNIYEPLPLERDSMGEDVTDLKILMERDSYRMTRLHRAAYYGNKEAVKEMLERIRQNLTNPEHKKVTGKIINEIMARDEFGFTPLYVAAIFDEEEIYHQMLAFLKQVLREDILATNTTDPEGFVHRGLSDAIDSENIPMFQLILKAVKKVLGQQELIRVLEFPNSSFDDLHRLNFSIACKRNKKLLDVVSIFVDNYHTTF
jgi:hypothetical protein